MEFTETINQTADILGAEYTVNESNNDYKVYTFKIFFDDDSSEEVHVYQEKIADDESDNQKEIIACEAYLGIYDDNIDLLDLHRSNQDLYFSRAYISEENKILIESCLFFESTSAQELSYIIDEIAQHANYLKEELMY